MSATLILAYQNPGRYAFNVLLGALEAVEDEGGLDIFVARDAASLLAATRSGVDAGRRTLVAWSFYSASFVECTEQLAQLRTAVAAPFTSLAGGVHATAEPLETLRAGFDRVAIGEGEHTIRALARAWRNGDSIDEVAGIARLVDGELAACGRASPVAHLDEFPAFSARKRRFGSIEITRGCIYACKFCQTPFVQKARFRHRSAENVAHWAAELRRAELRDVRFISPTSLSYGSDDERVNLAAVEDLLARVRAAMGRDGRVFFGTFPSEVRPEHVTHEALAVLAKYVDNDNLVIGGQSGSERVLQASHRGHDVEAIERAVRIALEAGFRPNVDFLLGLPGESREDVDATVALIERLSALGARAHGHTFMPLPGTPFRNAAAGLVDAVTEARLSALEGEGRLYGQWKRQMETARALVERRVEHSNRSSDALSS